MSEMYESEEGESVEHEINEALQEHIDFYQSFIEATDQGHREARTRRNYVNNKQWSPDEEEVIKRRKQPIITDNQIKRKTDYFLGIERQTRTDPKAYPRTPDSEEAAEAFTDGIRYVCDNSEWDIERSEGFDYLIVEGIEAYIVPVEKKPDGIDITPRHIPWDRVIYDFHSSDRYFRDCNKKGVITWMDLKDAKSLFPDHEDILDGSFQEDETTVFDDKPLKASWIDRDRKRIKLIQLYYVESGVWMHCVFTKAGFLIEPEESKYKDEYGRPDCPIELAGAYVDSDNDRFGLVQDMMSLQDMVNKMESKYTHFINSNQTWGNKKAGDPNALKKQAKMPDGHFELDGESVFGEDFGVVPTDNKAVASYNMLQMALDSLNEIGGNSIVADSASGRSKEVTSQTKNMELGAVLDTHRQCSRRVYKQIFNRIRQFWTDEKWVRVTDDENNLKFVQLNRKVTYAMAFEEKFGKDWLQKMPQLANHPNINDVARIDNNTTEIDVDIILDEAPDVINMQQEQFQVIAKLAESYGPEHVPFEEVLKLSSLRNKDAFLDKTKGSEEDRAAQAQKAMQEREKQMQMQVEAFMTEMREKVSVIELNEAKRAETLAKAQKALADEEKTSQETEALDIENELTVMAAGV